MTEKLHKVEAAPIVDTEKMLKTLDGLREQIVIGEIVGYCFAGCTRTGESLTCWSWNGFNNVNVIVSALSRGIHHLVCRACERGDSGESI